MNSVLRPSRLYQILANIDVYIQVTRDTAVIFVINGLLLAPKLIAIKLFIPVNVSTTATFVIRRLNVSILSNLIV